jgi:hypothetical protein
VQGEAAAMSQSSKGSDEGWRRPEEDRKGQFLKLRSRQGVAEKYVSDSSAKLIRPPGGDNALLVLR